MVKTELNRTNGASISVFHLPPYEGTKADSCISSMCSGTSRKPWSTSGLTSVDRVYSITFVFSAA